MTQITLTGSTVELLPLQREHKAALLEAAADGRKRNSVRFSIIDSEWPQVKASLQAKLRR